MFNAANSAHTARFGRGATIVRARGNEPLTIEQLRAAAPSVFAEEAHSSRSAKYTYIPTANVLAGLQKEGFQPFEVRQGGSKDAEKRSFTKHMIRFRHASLATMGDSHREIIMVNAHDGTSSYQMFDGVFRIVCANGLIASDGPMDMVRVPHKGDVVHQVIDAAYTVIEKGKEIASRLDVMRQIELKPAEQEAFAEAAAHLRFEEETVAAIQPRIINQARRRDDVGNDLWRTFNRTQENLVRGGLHYTQTNANNIHTNKTTRPVNGIDGNMALNRALWTLTARMAELKAA
ncbi:DUF932 domain-containing protein [Bradyrhizobium cenepequi]|uniref:DUF932 domain-containing protein n=1 Tax=Bradyrhizobium cenepequi TaxID=2821403 RepID=UPI001CE2C461|nr:DUF932 domain-containing protein [Bradyrhizobium cenepequi]MCA6108133.1 DUF945 domain-containing protein [Bradyrhizobium cenepequi]